MKVAFIGAHGQGKTTLVYEMAARFKRDGVNVEIVKEVARGCPLPINQNTSLEAQTWVLMTQIAKEIKAGSQTKLVVCDRSVLDNFAYLERACGFSYSRALEAWVYEWLDTYDLLIKVPLANTAIQEDGVRSTDAQFAIEIDQLIDALGHRFKMRAVWCQLSANRENWRNEAYTLIQDFGKKRKLL